MSGAAFDRLAAALFRAAGWGVPFDDMLPPEDRAYLAQHGDLGECLDPGRCLNCAEQRRAREAEAWRERWAGCVGPAALRDIEIAAACFGEPLPDPRSSTALDLVARARGLDARRAAR